MRKLWILTWCFFAWASAQTGEQIHHLFGLKQSALGPLTQAALNQQNGRSVEVETFSANFQFGGSYAYFTSSNMVLYVDSTAPSIGLIQQYLLPEIYSFNHSGLTGLSTLQGGISTICVNPLADSVIYAFDFTTKLPSLYFFNGGQFGTGNALTQLQDINSLSQVYAQSGIYIAGNNNANQVFLYRLNESSLQLIDTEVYNYESLYLVSDPQWGIYGVARDVAEQHFLVELDPVNLSLDTIVTLPSCVNCTQESFDYDKNAIVIDSDNGHLILSRSESAGGTPANYFLSTFDLTTGATIYDVQTADRWSNLIFQKPKDDLVYPGDANFDKEVDMTDILPIGLRYNDQVVERLVISNDWIGQGALNTQDTLANGVDKKHADCNGDGQINALDFDAVTENYSYIHYSEKSTQSACDFPLYIEFPNLVKATDEIAMQIGLDLSTNASQNIYGLVFTLEYDEAFVADTSGRITVQGGSTWFGTEDGDYIQRSIQVSPGRMDVGLVGIDQLNRAGGGGILLTGIWTMEDVVIPITQNYLDMNVRITDVKLIDYEENTLDACGVDTVIRVYDKSVGVFEREEAALALFPNPTTQNYINLAHVDAIEQVDMYDVQGRMVQTEIWGDQVYFGDIPKGVYLIKVYTEDQVLVNKLMYNKE